MKKLSLKIFVFLVWSVSAHAGTVIVKKGEYLAKVPSHLPKNTITLATLIPPETSERLHLRSVMKVEEGVSSQYALYLQERAERVAYNLNVQEALNNASTYCAGIRGVFSVESARDPVVQYTARVAEIPNRKDAKYLYLENFTLYSHCILREPLESSKDKNFVNMIKRNTRKLIEIVPGVKR